MVELRARSLGVSHLHPAGYIQDGEVVVCRIQPQRFLKIHKSGRDIVHCDGNSAEVSKGNGTIGHNPQHLLIAGSCVVVTPTLNQCVLEPKVSRSRIEAMQASEPPGFDE
jgi:hypothetical protein